MAENSALFHLTAVPVLEDRPIISEAEDKLDRSTFISGLIRALVADQRDENDHLIARRSTNYVVGLTGAWGSGKSSVINLLALKLGSMDRVLVTTLNPWLFKGREELLTAFFNSLRTALGKSRKEQLTGAINALDHYQEAIGIAAQVPKRSLRSPTP
jgi:predicted KAP-like P-loop ATPase